jgi:uncharacterized metal-binding protein YceD (DUF177 family)
VKKNTEYIIPYEGLKEGRHHFTFEITDEFFESFETERDFKEVNIHMEVDLMKDITMLVFDFNHEGKALVACDRCLVEIPQQISAKNKLIVKFGDEVRDDNEMIITLPEGEYEIDLSPFIYEYIRLSFPWKMDCSGMKETEKPCDEEVLKKIAQLQENKDDNNISDPRWEALRKLK